MTSALRMSDNYFDNNSGARPDMGGEGGLRGTPVVPLPLPAPSPPLMPSVAQGVSCSTGRGRSRGRGPAWYLCSNSTYSSNFQSFNSIYSYSSNFPTPDAECGAGGELLYRGGSSQGRGL